MIIKFDPSRMKSEVVRPARELLCDHKLVTAYTEYRTVRCTVCDAELDPFDVLVDMLKAYVPQEKRF